MRQRGIASRVWIVLTEMSGVQVRSAHRGLPAFSNRRFPRRGLDTILDVLFLLPSFFSHPPSSPPPPPPFPQPPHPSSPPPLPPPPPLSLSLPSLSSTPLSPRFSSPPQPSSTLSSRYSTSESTITVTLASTCLFCAALQPQTRCPRVEIWTRSRTAFFFEERSTPCLTPPFLTSLRSVPHPHLGVCARA